MRRCDLLQLTPAERAIHDAIQAVEQAGSHPLLTDAVILLGQAQNAVADFVDGGIAAPDIASHETRVA